MDWLTIREFLLDTIKMATTIFIIFFVMVYVCSITQVVGDSMNPTLKSGEVLVLDKLKYRFFDIERGDIVSIEYDDSKFLIKRIIGLPGENVTIKNNQVYINGLLLSEEYLDAPLNYDDFHLSSLGYTTIPADMYLVLGDNREDSMDSRDSKVGLISKDEVMGKIDARIWPIADLSIF